MEKPDEISLATDPKRNIRFWLQRKGRKTPGKCVETLPLDGKTRNHAAEGKNSIAMQAKTGGRSRR
jgi:hypothetical protein